MKKFISTVLVLFLMFVTGCTTVQRTTLVDGVLGRYPHFNAVELDKSVDIQLSIKILENRRDYIDTVVAKIGELRLYGLNRPYNSRVTKQIDGLQKIAIELQTRLKKGDVGNVYFSEKLKVMTEIANNIRMTISMEKL